METGIINKDDLKTFFHVVFSGCSGLIPFRSFPEGENSDSSPHNIWVKADDNVLGAAETFTEWADRSGMGFFVIPGTVENKGEASAEHIKQMQVLLIDIDTGDIEGKLRLLHDTIGQPTMVVESGGMTDEGQKKLHVYWQLEKAVSGDELEQLVELRYQIALFAGGDLHFKSPHQPIRVAGSMYHKRGSKNFVKIQSYEPVEYPLDELAIRFSNLTKNRAATCPNYDKNRAAQSDDIMDFNNAPVKNEEILTSKVYAGGEGEKTRFYALQRVVGYWLRRVHNGLIENDKAWEEIAAYNEANVVPPWPEDRLHGLVNGLWRKHIRENGEVKKVTQVDNVYEESQSKKEVKFGSYSIIELLADQTEIPDDLIAPRILTPGGLLVFGGAPKVGKSDFLLSLFTHLAAGEEFIGFKPTRPLKIFYFQAEIGYHYLRERLQNMKLPEELIEKAKDNLYITPNTKLVLDDNTVDVIADHVNQLFPEKPDIIAVDPIRNVFDGGRDGATENENDSMLFFLQKRVEKLRDKINPDAGIILVHHTKKLSQKQFDEDPFQAFSGASSLRGYYSSGVLLYKPDIENNDRKLIFELRNGAGIPAKIVTKAEGRWIEEDELSKRVAFRKQGSLFDKERTRRVSIIIRLLESEALKGKFYLMKQFGEKFRNTHDLGNKRAICDDCSAAATKGDIKFFNNPEKYNLSLGGTNPGFGFMCTANMKMHTGQIVNDETGEIFEGYKKVLPTHYKRDCDGEKIEMESPENFYENLENDEVNYEQNIPER